MSRLTDLIRQAKVKDPQLGADLEAEIKTLSGRRAFGLNFEKHKPEAVALPQRTPRKGDKVQVLPERGSLERGDTRLWRVTGIERVEGLAVAQLSLLEADDPETQSVALTDLVVVAEFRDPIYPGLKSTGKVERGGDKPFHTVINAENFHALQTLLYTHSAKVDAIYIDPPYNTGARDWKYNNDYVETEDLYRHSKWLAFMERRLKLARELLNPSNSVLIVTIDEKEYLRLGMLLEQTFPEASVQMVTTVINPKGSTRGRELARVDEYVFIVYFGVARALPTRMELLQNGISSASGKHPQIWYPLIRSGPDSRREDNKQGYYPLYIDKIRGRIVEVGEPLLPVTAHRDSVPPKEGLIAVWPIRSDGSDGRWQVSCKNLPSLIQNGTVRVGSVNSRTKQVSITYLKSAELERLNSGEIECVGRDANGAMILRYADVDSRERMGKTVWNSVSHDAGEHGSKLIGKMLHKRKFPFPKSLYAVEDALRFFVKDNPSALIVDFFSGSGTTAHAVMRLNKQDGGTRRSICVTNNEVSADEQVTLLTNGLRPGDPDWEKHGICDYITKPRIMAAVTGNTPDGSPIKGDYKFTDIFPMSDGFEENVEFFNLTYETSRRVAHNRAFEAVAPLLWLKAGAQGRRIESLDGYDVADTYGVLEDLDQAPSFLSKLADVPSVRMAFIVTSDDRRYQMVCADLPEGVEPVRLYESYLQNFEINTGRD